MISRIPWRLLGYALLAVLLIANVNTALGYIPFTPQWSAKQAAAKVKTLEGSVSSLERTAEGNAEIGRAVETYHTREVVIRADTAQAIEQARTAPDADTPLSDERAARLRAADERLCASSNLCPGPAADAS